MVRADQVTVYKVVFVGDGAVGKVRDVFPSFK